MSASAVVKRAASSADRWAALALLLSTLLAGPAAAAELFGLALANAGENPAIGASREDAPATLLLFDAEAGAGLPSWNGAPLWHFATAQELPKPLRSVPTQLQVARSNDGDLFWLVLEAEPPSCSDAADWLDAALARKYAPATWLPAAQGKTLTTPSYRIALSCAPQLRLEYLVTSAYERAYEQTIGSQAAARARQLQRDRNHIRRLRTRQVAANWLRGTRSRIESLYGFSMVGANASLTELPADVPTALPVDQQHLPFEGASHEVVVAPDGTVIRLVSKLEDSEQTARRKLDETLVALFGEPYRRGRASARYRVGGQWLITRHRPPQTSFVYLNQLAQDAMEAREIAQERAQFEAETEGL